MVVRSGTFDQAGGGRSVAAFYGTETHAIDHKGRVSIPASMRKASGRRRGRDSFYMVRGLDGCVALYPPEEFKRVEEHLRRLPWSDRRGRLFARMFLQHAQHVLCDAQGRVTLSPALLQWADLKKEALVCGQVDRIELWNPARFESHVAASPDTLEQLMAEVFKEERE